MQRNSWLKFIIFALCVAVCVAIDQITKILCVANIPLGESVNVIPGVLRFTYIQNKGAAFGSFANARWVFMVASCLLIVLITCYVISNRKCLGTGMVISLGMIAGGGIGNMVDRIAYGYVIDFIDFIFLPFWKWIFNGADSFVCVGAVLLVIVYLVAERKKEKTKKADGEEC